MKLSYAPKDPEVSVWAADLHEFTCSGVFMGMYNTDESIHKFARICFDYALNSGMGLRMATKQSFLRFYDSQFRHIFNEKAEAYAEDFHEKLIDYEHRNVDDMI